MQPKTVSATDAKNRFGGVLREVNQTDEPIVVERDGKPVAVILSMEAYERLLPKERPLTLKESQAPYAFGLWANRDDIDEEWLANGRSRWESSWRDE
ncbi:MAG: type II toxin-antitoxin system Phd/YefM family antitoxin [Ardenticatenaceae bacterium]|nr:type II toxin-antitoxin system Phd/YefM family antitoxin [Anaerolineales bacterium]MCB8941599.1 type II toxin-antitoxin system Phd/YefM family antitoxin [Ardenticatenaceae bacterium]MCB8974506.1 type II toxin-antitoxin system Phd/YefM family antitoxin [Ardenticatenaceae bacterium]